MKDINGILPISLGEAHKYPALSAISAALRETSFYFSPATLELTEARRGLTQ